MKIYAQSHVAIGVRDMERALRFYRDFLGLKVSLDQMEPPNAAPGADGKPAYRRRGVYLRWEEGPHATFVVLNENVGGTKGESLPFESVGAHHFSFWVDDLQDAYDRAMTEDVEVFIPPTESSGDLYGEDKSHRMRTVIFRDPDGTYVQLDQRLS